MPPADKPYYRFIHSKALRNRTLALLDAIDTDDDPTVHRNGLADHIVELTDAGMSYFFLEPLKKLKMSFVVNQSASLGIGSTLRIMGPVVRNIVGRMDKKQLRQLSKIMRKMME
ncbi:MAG: hypothetical protein GC168_04985 [Candidatus Hydrogenedens sp.]|nr:hypothetical protein [Candidatus Hydrogenedens sp.]